MSLNLNQILQNKYPHLEISVLNLSDAMKDNEKLRIDAEFFQSKFTKLDNLLSKKNCKNLQSITKSIRKGIFDISPSHYLEKGIPFLRVQNIQNSFLDTSNCVFISEEYSKNEFKTELHYGDLALSKVGSVGRFCFITETVNTSQNVTSIKVNQQEINSHYLFIFLISKYGQMQFERQQSQQVQSKLELDDIRKTTIPLFPLSFQQQIEQMVKESHLCLEQSKALYREAEVLLYRELGLDPENPLASIETLSGSLNIAVRTLKESFLDTGRLDSEYYQTKYDEIERIIKNQKFAKLSDLVDMQKSIEPGSEAYQENGIPFIRVSNFNKFGISDTDIFLNQTEFKNAIMPKNNTILLSKDGSIGTAYCVKDEKDFITSSALLHLNIKNEQSSNILPEYLTLVLNSILVKLQAERDSGGSIIAHWRINEIEEILIPILDISIQQKIENLIKQSFMLRGKANDLLLTAKQTVETAIEQG